MNFRISFKMGLKEILMTEFVLGAIVFCMIYLEIVFQ
jgi:hypothetical protein